MNNLLMQEALNFRVNLDFERCKSALQRNNFTVLSLPINCNIPRTPIDGNFDVMEIKEIALMLLNVHHNLGLLPVVYEGENDGQLIRNVCPIEKNKNQIGSQGSVYDFDMHVDNPDLRLNGEDRNCAGVPNTLSLFCLRNSEQIATNLVHLDDVLSKLNEEEISLLMENEFDVTESLPLLTFHEGKYHTRFDSHNVSSKSEKHKTVLDKFRKLANDNNIYKSFNLQMGDFIIFNNQRMLHSRKAFTPKFNGLDRWLLRVFGIYEKPSPEFLCNKNDNHHLKTICS